ncbi:uncharacterized protein bcl2l12 [Osmerus eperlanus]|uniref:uncharacterized protein bcl2l12 n=1 Tax=Osmerus eperlanus TaxID=29151 RepID=UPI002E10519D
MSEEAEAPSSPSPSVSSVSLVEIKEDTRLVLKAFLRHSLAVPPGERAGRVGGGYRDCTKYSASVKDPRRRAKDVLNSQEDEASSASDKRSFKDIIKRLQPRRSLRDGPDHTKKASLEKEGGQKGTSPAVSRLRDKLEAEPSSASSTSEEEGSQVKLKKKKKKNKLKSQISSFFKKKEDVCQRPSTLSINKEPESTPALSSPSHPPEFYEEVAETLDRIVQRSHSTKKPSPVLSATTPLKPAPARDKDQVVKELAQVLSIEGDAINIKIQSDPFLRSTLTRLSYPSFAKLLDTFASEAQVPALPASPTLRRVAITMEVSRRVVTATGTQRMQGYAERYMENFAPWVKSQGGWEGIVQLEEVLEYD